MIAWIRKGKDQGPKNKDIEAFSRNFGSRKKPDNVRTMWQAGGRKRVQSEEAQIAKTTTGLEMEWQMRHTPLSESESPFLLMIIELGEALQPCYCYYQVSTNSEFAM